MTGARLPFPVSPQLQDLLLWKDVRASGIVFGLGVVAWLFTVSPWAPFSPAQLLSLVVLVTSITSLAWNLGAPLLKRSGPVVPRLLEEGVTEEQGKLLVDKALVYINPGLAFAGKLVSGKHLKLSASAIGASYLALRIFAFFDFFTLAFAAFVLAFTLPKVYEAKQADIDRILALALAKLKELYAKADETVFKKIPGSYKKID